MTAALLSNKVKLDATLSTLPNSSIIHSKLSLEHVLNWADGR